MFPGSVSSPARA